MVFAVVGWFGFDWGLVCWLGLLIVIGCSWLIVCLLG